jgi:lysozyme
LSRGERAELWYLRKMLYGIDVSQYQGTIDWDAVASTRKVEFVYARAIHVTAATKSGEDSAFIRNHDECTRLGVPFGAYLFYVPQADEAVQARSFLSFAKGRYGRLRPMIDVEDGPDQVWSDSLEARTSKLLTCIHIIEATLGPPIVYTNRSTWSNQFDNASILSSYRLWVADYPQQSGKPKNLPEGWKDWTVHQYSSDRSFIPGIDKSVDLDCLNADDISPLGEP